MKKNRLPLLFPDRGGRVRGPNQDDKDESDGLPVSPGNLKPTITVHSNGGSRVFRRDTNDGAIPARILNRA